MLRRLKSTAQNEMIRNNLVFFIGSMVVGALNYLLYPIISRVISVQEFGELQVLINLLVQVLIFTNVIALFVVNVATNMKRISDIRSFIRNLEAVVLLISMSVAVIIILSSPLLAQVLQYDSFIPFWVIGLILILNVPMSIRIGFLRSQKAFAETSYAQVLQSSLRLLFATGAGLLGLSVAGIMFGMAGSMVASIFLVVLLSNKYKLFVSPLASFSHSSLQSVKQQLQSLKGTGRYMALVTAVSFSGMFLLSIDTILAKFFFDPEQAGLYGGVSVVARIIFFGTASITGVLASSVKVKDSLQLNRKRLLGSSVLVVAAGGAVAALFSWQPERVVELLVGSDYLQLSQILPQLSLAVLGVSVVNLLFTYHVAVRDMMIIPVAAFGIVITCISLLLNNQDPAQLASGLLIGILLMLAVTMVWSITWHVKHLSK